MIVPVKYKVALRESEEGFSVHVPGLPGCWSQGETEDEAVANIGDAIRQYLLARADPVNAFTMGGIVRDAGLSVEEFKRLL